MSNYEAVGAVYDVYDRPYNAEIRDLWGSQPSKFSRAGARKMTGVSSKKAAFVFALLALFMALSAADLVAQSDTQFDKTYPFIGHWGIFSTNTEGEDRGN